MILLLNAESFLISKCVTLMVTYVHILQVLKHVLLVVLYSSKNNVNLNYIMRHRVEICTQISFRAKILVFSGNEFISAKSPIEDETLELN